MNDDIIQSNTSARTGEGVREMFQQIAERIVDIKAKQND